MPEYLAPGVYIEEIDIGAKPIEGVGTSTAGFLGETERGPTVPRLVTNLEQFRRRYGGYSWAIEPAGESGAVQTHSFLPYAVEGFFANGGKRCFIGRVASQGCQAASLAIEPAGGGSAARSTKKSRSIKKPDNPEEAAAEIPSESAASHVDADNPLFMVTAVGPGTWGNRIGIRIEQASLQSEKRDKLFKLVVSYWTNLPVDLDNETAAVLEEYDNLSPEVASPDFFEKRINDNSNLVSAQADPAAGEQRPVNMESLSFLQGGADGKAVALSDYMGAQDASTGERTGLSAFETVDEITMVCAPNENDNSLTGLSDALVAHCENMKDRFAVLQASRSAGPVGRLEPPVDSKYAAFYYPWLKVIDPVTNLPKLVPPGGHMVGIYARSDIQRGVHKAPANEPVRGISELQLTLTKGEQDVLNPRGVNCIRAFPGRGIRVWGARTTSSDPMWKYVNVRRLFLYLEESIEEGTQWVVFEPNDQRLWARVKQGVVDFLKTEWKKGALMGNTPDEAFFVKCDETTMTDNDIENGRLIVLIGVAPVRPAEFVVFRIAQWRSGSAIAE